MPRKISSSGHGLEAGDEDGGRRPGPEHAERAAQALDRIDPAEHDAREDVRERRADERADEGRRDDRELLVAPEMARDDRLDDALGDRRSGPRR